MASRSREAWSVRSLRSRRHTVRGRASRASVRRDKAPGVVASATRRPPPLGYVRPLGTERVSKACGRERLYRPPVTSKERGRAVLRAAAADTTAGNASRRPSVSRSARVPRDCVGPRRPNIPGRSRRLRESYGPDGALRRATPQCRPDDLRPHTSRFQPRVPGLGPHAAATSTLPVDAAEADGKNNRAPPSVQRTIACRGSLGSHVDEERSQLRYAM